MTYTVYSITYNNQDIYIGYTSSISKRQKQHNYLFKKKKEKELYTYLHTQKHTLPIVLNPIKVFQKKADAKRYEMYLILIDYFSGNPLLKQHIPNISDR
jgi:predicted GIY-YIG superfamily endonuclease